ncbi:type VI secretion system contractile sheath large subunit [Roseomonas sp. GCM10028921]
MSTAELTEGARHLAELASIAVRIEPQLLRRLRLALAPGLDAATEAALWFSPDLVSLRAPTGLVLAEGVLPTLRAGLAADADLLDLAWAVTAEAHALAAPALRVEEELTYLALKGLEHPEVEKRARELLRSVLRTLIKREGRLAGWADRAVPRLPPAVLELEEAQMVARGAALRLGRAGPLAALGAAGLAAEEWSWLAPDTLRRLPMSLRWVEGGIEFGPPSTPMGHDIQVPALLPLAVHVWPGGSESGLGERVPLRHGRRNFVPVSDDVHLVEVQLLGGPRISLRRPGEMLGKSNTYEDKLRQVRNPRVVIRYDVETEGAQFKRELPFVIGVLGDFAGHGRATGAKPPSERRFIYIDREHFDEVLFTVTPTLLLADEALGTIRLTFRRMADFEPGGVIGQIEPLRAVLAARTALRDLVALAARSERLEELLMELMTDRTRAGAMAVGELLNFFRPLLNQPGMEQLRMLVPTAVKTLLAWTGEPYQGLSRTVSVLIAEEDARLSRELNRVMHHPDFLRLEGTWRGLLYLVSNAETSPSLKIRLIDFSKAEIAAELNEENGGRVRHMLYEYEFGSPGGEPYGALVGDYEWNASVEDMSCLDRIARLAATIHAPFLSAASPSLLGIESWQQLHQSRVLAGFANPPDMVLWRNLRAAEESRHLALTVPRALARLPYGAATSPVEEFAYEEVRGVVPPEHRCWMNAAYVLAGRMAAAFAKYGWVTAIRGAEGGGAVTDLPMDDMGDGQRRMSDVQIDDRYEAALSSLGFLPLTSYSQSGYAVFFSAQTVHRYARYDRPEATANSAIASRLPYVMATGRFMHYLMIMSRGKIGSFMAPEECEILLNRWIQNYVNANENADPVTKARYPLREALVEIRQEEGHPSTLTCVAYLRPWLQMEELTTSMRVTAPIPAMW